MQFTHDVETALLGVASLINTLPAPRRDDADLLPTIADLDAFVRAGGWTGSRTRDRRELDEVRALRPRLRELWERDEAAVVRLVNEMLAGAKALPQLVDHDGLGWHLHATPRAAPLATRMAVEAAMAMVDVIRAGELDRLRVCAADDCGDVFMDLSRNRSRRFCSTTCGNRIAAAAYRERHSQVGEE